MIDANTLGILAALGSAAAWSIGAVLFKQLGESLSSFAMTLIKGVLSVTLLALLTLLTGGFAPISREDFLYLSVSGIIGIAISDTFFFSALKELTPQAMTLLFTFGQVITVVMALLFLGETLSPAGWTGIVLIIVGITYGMYPSVTEHGRSSRKGILLGLMSILSMSSAVILTKKGLHEVATLQATCIRMLAGTLGMLLVGIITRRLGHWVTPFRNPHLVVRFALSVVVITFGGFWLAIVAFKYTSVAVANSLISTEPLFVLPMAALFLKEKITLQAAAGAGVATVGVIILCAGSSSM
jgi:drug/metabolite transporter (DMT)-like permease